MVTGHHERRKLFWKIKEYGLSEEKLIRFVRVCLNDLHINRSFQGIKIHFFFKNLDYKFLRINLSRKQG